MSNTRDIEPMPADEMIIRRGEMGGWLVMVDGRPLHAFTTAADMARWLHDLLGALDQPRVLATDPLPRGILPDHARTEPASGGFLRVIFGGRT